MEVRPIRKPPGDLRFADSLAGVSGFPTAALERLPTYAPVHRRWATTEAALSRVF
jgi:hypothetical protein